MGHCKLARLDSLALKLALVGGTKDRLATSRVQLKTERESELTKGTLAHAKMIIKIECRVGHMINDGDT